MYLRKMQMSAGGLSHGPGLADCPLYIAKQNKRIGIKPSDLGPVQPSVHASAFSWQSANGTDRSWLANSAPVGPVAQPPVSCSHPKLPGNQLPHHSCGSDSLAIGHPAPVHDSLAGGRPARMAAARGRQGLATGYSWRHQAPSRGLATTSSVPRKAADLRRDHFDGLKLPQRLTAPCLCSLGMTCRLPTSRRPLQEPQCRYGLCSPLEEGTCASVPTGLDDR